MVWLAVNKFSLEDSPLELKERIFAEKPKRAPNGIWNVQYANPGVEVIGIGLPEGTIFKLLGHEMAWEDEAIEIR